MSSSLHRNNTQDLLLLLHQLKQVNNKDHIGYPVWDFLQWFPTEEDEAEAQNTPAEKRTDKQKKLLQRKRLKDDENQMRQNYENHMHSAGLKPDKTGFFPKY